MGVASAFKLPTPNLANALKEFSPQFQLNQIASFSP